MEADGALEKKLQAYSEVSKLYASAIKDYKGHWVPSVVMRVRAVWELVRRRQARTATL